MVDNVVFVRAALMVWKKREALLKSAGRGWGNEKCFKDSLDWYLAMKEKQIATEELDCESIMSLISESEDALCE